MACIPAICLSAGPPVSLSVSLCLSLSLSLSLSLLLSSFFWYRFEAEIRHIDRGRLLLHFLGWHDKYNEWIPVDAVDRLAPKNTYTCGPYKPKNQNKQHRVEGSGPPSAKGIVGLRNLGNTYTLHNNRLTLHEVFSR